MQERENPSLIRILKGHKESIMAMDLHPKCRYVASAGLDSNFLIWDMKTWQPRRFEGHKNTLQDLKFHPNGSLIASASSDGAIKFWDVENSAKEVTLTKAHNSKIRSINYSCDGQLLVSAGDDKNVKIWSTIDRRLVGQYKQHENWVRYAEFSPIAKSLISCDDRAVFIWDVATKKVIQQYKEHSGVIHQAKFHSLGNIAASCSHDKKIKLYDIRARQVIQIYEGHTGAVKSFDFHPHTAHLISSSEDGTTKIWNTQKSILEYTLDSPSNVTKFSREGDYFVSAGVEKTINLWKTGFYDSFKEKIKPSEGTVAANKQKVRYEINQIEKRIQTEQSAGFGGKAKAQGGNGAFIAAEKRYENEPDLVYDHQKQNFEMLANQNENKPADGESRPVIPQRLAKKMKQIASQLDFITKTTQILEARVLNNGEHLKRLVEMVKMQEEERPEEDSQIGLS